MRAERYLDLLMLISRYHPSGIFHVKTQNPKMMMMMMMLMMMMMMMMTTKTVMMIMMMIMLVLGWQW